MLFRIDAKTKKGYSLSNYFAMPAKFEECAAFKINPMHEAIRNFFDSELPKDDEEIVEFSCKLVERKNPYQ